MANQSGTGMLTKFFLPILWIFGLIIFGISIAGIVESQYVFAVHLFVVVLVFIIFMGLLSAIQVLLQRKSETTGNYNVEAGSDSKAAGKENKGYDTLDKTKDAAKWVNNYVPYNEYPKGNEESGNVNGTTVQVSEGDEIDFKEAKIEEDEPEDSNKQE